MLPSPWYLESSDSTKVSGSGTINTLPKFTASGTIGNSSITDDGTQVYTTKNIGIGTATPATPLQVLGKINSITSVARGTSVEFLGQDSASLGNYPRAFFYGHSVSTIVSFGLYIASGDAIGASQTPSFIGLSTNADVKQAASKQAVHYLTTTYYKISTLTAENAENYIDIHFGGDFSSTTDSSVIIKADGKVGIKTPSPSAQLHLPAGTATANTAPLKFNSGTLNTTAEAGAVEFLTDDFYATITTSAVRKTLAYTPAQTDVTASRALNTTYTAPATRSIMVLATVRCAISLAGGNATAQGKSDGSTPPTTVASGIVGIEAGLLGEDNSYQLSFVVAAGQKYRIDSAATNGTVVLGKWFEVTY
jgi:hypothetical protein